MNLKIFAGAGLAFALLISCEKELDINDPGNLVPKTVVEDPSLPSVSVNGTTLHAETFGNPSNPMLVFLHGGPGGDYRNALIVKELANDGYFVVFYDQRGSGLSQRHNKNSYSIQLMFDDLTAVISHYRTSPDQKVFLFGHSWGGMLAAGYINQFPSQIDGVIFAEPAGITKKLFDEYGEASRRIEVFQEHVSDVVFIDQFITGGENDHNILDYKLNVASSFTYASGNIEGIEGASPLWRNGAVVLKALADIAEEDGFDFTTTLSQFHAKVLFLYSENNKAYGLDFAQSEAVFFSNTEIREIENTGHEMIYFHWTQVYPIVLNYLNELN